MPDRKITLFLSHASEDKESLVEPLYHALKDEFDVWYDKAHITLGDSIYEKISEGIRGCDFGVVVVSPDFLRKNWTQEEFNGLKSLQTEKRKVILPILHNLTIDELRAKWPIEAGKLSINSSEGIPAIVRAIHFAVGADRQNKDFEQDELKKRFEHIQSAESLNRKFDQLGSTEQGVRLVWTEVSSLYSLLESRVAELRGKLALPVVRDRSQPAYFIMVYGPKKLVLRFNIRNIYANSVRETRLEQRHYFEHEDYAGAFQGIQLIDECAYLPFFSENDQVVWLFANDRSAYNSADVVTRALNAFGSRIQEVLENRLFPSNTIQ